LTQDFPNHSHGGTDPGPRDVIRDRENPDVHVSWRDLLLLLLFVRS
jgi:hypothetical protein